MRRTTNDDDDDDELDDDDNLEMQPLAPPRFETGGENQPKRMPMTAKTKVHFQRVSKEGACQIENNTEQQKKLGNKQNQGKGRKKRNQKNALQVYI